MQRSRDAKIPQFNHSIPSKEYVLCLDVSMNDLFLMDVFECETYHSEPIKNRILAQRFLFGLDFLYLLTEVASIRITHDDVEMPFLSGEGVKEFDNKRVIAGVECLKYVDLSENIMDLCFSHTHDLDLLKDTELLSFFVLNQVAFAVGALAKHF